MAEYLDGAVEGGVEKVPEGLRDYYEETEINGAKWAMVRVKPAEIGDRHYAFEDVAGLKKTNVELKREKSTIKTQFDETEKRATELAAAKKDLDAKIELLQKSKGKDDPELTERLAKYEADAQAKLAGLIAQHQKEMKEKDDIVHVSTSVTAVDVALAEIKVKPEYKELIRKEMLASTKTEILSGRPVAIIIDGNGEMRTSTKLTSMEPMTPKELAEEMCKRYPSCFQQSEQTTGVGTPPTHRAASSSALAATTPVSEWTRQQKMDFIAKNGPEAWEAVVMGTYKSPFSS